MTPGHQLAPTATVISAVPDSPDTPVSPILAQWLLSYSPATRATYGDALGLDRAQVAALSGATTKAEPARRPPPHPGGRFRHLAWFRWCTATGLDPTQITTTQVLRWQHALVVAGMAKATRAKALTALDQCYGYLAEHGLIPANPAALSRQQRQRLVLNTAADTSATLTLVPDQVRLLLAAAKAPRRGQTPLLGRRTYAIVALFTLGLRVSELADLDRADRRRERGRDALRITGKGGKTRVVYLHPLATAALDAYLADRDTADGTALPAHRGQVRAGTTPLIATRDGGRLHRADLWALLRRLVTSAGPGLADLAQAMHPHALRHFYVTAAVEAGADLHHIAADVGHSSTTVTSRVYDHAARDPARSATDLVGDTLRPTPNDKS